MRRLLIAVFLVAAMVLATAGVAMAGEITGNGERPMVVEELPDGHMVLHGKSACAFSGLNDDWEGDPDVAGADGFYRTQSWGQLSKEDKALYTAFGAHPGMACNPHRAAAHP